jgi:hypothetical protein
MHGRHSAPICRCDITPFASLASILLFSTPVLTEQSRSQSSHRVIRRLAPDLQDQTAKNSVHDRLRGVVGSMMAGGLMALVPILLR